MKKRLLSLALVTLSSFALAGCNNSSEELEIKFNDIVPTAYVGEEYDFSYILEQDDGVSYSLQAFYHDYYEMKEHELPVNNLCFTPTTDFEITAVCTATKGDSVAKRTCIIPVTQKGDPIDELLVSGGYSGYSDAGATKTLETNEQYKHGEDSSTSIAVHYAGNNPYTWGCTVLSPSNFRCLEHWSDQDWENTILTFWVFNPTEYDIEFQIRVKDQYTNLVDIDWGHSMNTPQFAKPNQWTQIFFSMRKIGVDHTLYINEDGSRKDELNVKMKWKGTPAVDPVTQSCPVYTYQFYVDGLDFVNASQYPDIDTKCTAKAETIEQGWENMMLDTTPRSGYATANAYYNREVVRQSELDDSIKSKSSIELTFKDTSISSDDWGYGVCWNVAGEFQNVQSDLPSFTHGTLTADIKFSDNIANNNVSLKAVDSGWIVNTETQVELTPLSDGWYRFNIDLAEDGTFSTIKKVGRFGFKFAGIDSTNKDTAIINIDNIFFNQQSGTPEPASETIEDGLENLPIDAGFSSSLQKYVADPCKANPNSTLGLQLSFNGVSPKNYGNGLSESGYGVSFLTDNLAYMQNLSSGTLDFDIKYTSDIEDYKVRIYVFKNWDVSAFLDVEPTSGPTDGWYHYSINLSNASEFNQITSTIRVNFGFWGVTSANKYTAKVTMDNIALKA